MAALLYKVQGPILQHVNQHTQVWDMANAGTDIRANKCHPTPVVEDVPCCACAGRNTVPPVIPVEEFLFCKPVVGGSEVAATECGTSEHNLAPPKAHLVATSSCPVPVLNP